ncbi:MAG: hypothetical protein LUG13_10245 [Oscillospiraceae bacterium]|nr:hypothetical protein [Oscillospiraceae bacterium]
MEPNQNNPVSEVQGRRRATAAKVCGILSIVLCWTSFPGIVLGVIAMIVAKHVKEVGPADAERTAKTGFFTGFIGIIISAIFLVIYILLIVLIAEQLGVITYPIES